MEITKDTRVSDLLEEYGDIAEVMEMFGITRVGRFSVRKLLTKALTVERAAFVHRVPLNQFLEILNKAIAAKTQSLAVKGTTEK
ncbi:MAG: DUF1858 domain-containing protein [Caldilineaceae bacterium]